MHVAQMPETIWLKWRGKGEAKQLKWRLRAYSCVWHNVSTLCNTALQAAAAAHCVPRYCDRLQSAAWSSPLLGRPRCQPTTASHMHPCAGIAWLCNLVSQRC
jgi:hypothetical protein